MSNSKTIKSALISVFNKEGLGPIAQQLHANGVTIYSTGGTQSFIESLDIPVERVEDLTSYPSILDGRVKTLHPKIFGGILGIRDDENHKAQMAEYEIPNLDVVIVDLYPFEDTVASGASEADIIEKIDIGGISLIRAAAKNFNDVAIVPSMNQYSYFLEAITQGNGATTLEQRRQLSMDAFDVSSHYDSAIYNQFSGGEHSLKVSNDNISILRYGENPHQKGYFYGDMDALFNKLHGKELSYNNLLDVDAAVNLMREFKNDKFAFAILKHNNACGLAIRDTLLEAYNDALAGDPVSAFGGVLISNSAIDMATAEEVNKLFCEVVIAPAYNDEALALLKSKKNRVILVQKEVNMPTKTIRTALNGFLVQEKDLITDQIENFTAVTNKKVTSQEEQDLVFASKLAKHTKSNTIVLAKNNQLLAGGTGQTSRVDALRQSIHKAKSFNFDLNGAVMASDAFFPFADCVEIAHEEGITAVIQPGGSIRDKDSIEYCNANDMAMVTTGTRHFKH